MDIALAWALAIVVGHVIGRIVLIISNVPRD